MNQYMTYIFSFASRFLLFPLYALSYLVPRRDSLWVFGSWGGYRYADNAAAFFRFCQRRLSGDRDLVWISRRRAIVAALRNEGYRAHWIYSPAGLLTCLRAGHYVFDCFVKDINFWTSGGARLVNLWSGVPLKTFERDIDHPDNRYYRLFHGNPVERLLYAMMMPWHARRPDLIIAMSEETAEITRRAFDLDASQVRITGFPRNDALLREAARDELPAAFADALARGQRILLYLPTFRDSGKPFLKIDWRRLNDRMRARGAMFFCKFHPVDASVIPDGHSNIRALPQDLDVYSLLPHADMLVSDYSSIIFDYMLLDRPIVYYAPDIDEFVSENRSLNFDPREIAVGPVCRSFDELLDALDGGLDRATGRDVIADAEKTRRAGIFRRLHTYRDDGACERVLAMLLEGSRLPVSAYRPRRGGSVAYAKQMQRTPQQRQ